MGQLTDHCPTGVCTCPLSPGAVQMAGVASDGRSYAPDSRCYT